MHALWHIDAPHYNAGIVIRNGYCVEAAPILNWAVGKRESYLRGYFARKRYKVIESEIKP